MLTGEKGRDHRMNEMTGDTIAAIATASGQAGLAIVRVSGPQSHAIADRIFRCRPPRPSVRPGNTFVHGFVSPVLSQGGADVDEAILLIYRAPRSYTREDAVEIQGHGGRACAQRILRCVLENGARPAEPGEFTRRAFLNGRIDLLQAEAVADLIGARTARAAAAAMEQLEGGLSQRVNATFDSLLAAATVLEASLDFPEEDLVEESAIEEVGGKVAEVCRSLRELLATWDEGHLLWDGALVVISGQPNAGKSSLMNALLGRSRAIVAEQPGTTRDTIEEELVIGGTAIRLVDTAGLRESGCSVEREGVMRAKACVASADVNLHVVDGSVPLTEDGQRILNGMDAKKSVILLNKNDLITVIDRRLFVRFAVVECSALTGAGLDRVRHAVAIKLGLLGSGPPRAVISERHRNIIQNVLNVLENMYVLDNESVRLDASLAASDIRAAMEQLGNITGRTYTDDLLSSIFSKFCIGK
jgi:tRNA modification GTPase